MNFKTDSESKLTLVDLAGGPWDCRRKWRRGFAFSLAPLFAETLVDRRARAPAVIP